MRGVCSLLLPLLLVTLVSCIDSQMAGTLTDEIHGWTRDQMAIQKTDMQQDLSGVNAAHASAVAESLRVGRLESREGLRQAEKDNALRASESFRRDKVATNYIEELLQERRVEFEEAIAGVNKRITTGDTFILDKLGRYEDEVDDARVEARFLNKEHTQTEKTIDTLKDQASADRGKWEAEKLMRGMEIAAMVKAENDKQALANRLELTQLGDEISKQVAEDSRAEIITWLTGAGTLAAAGGGVAFLKRKKKKNGESKQPTT